MLNRYTASEGGLVWLEKSGQSTMIDTMKGVIVGLNRLERLIGMDGEAVRIQLNLILFTSHQQSFSYVGTGLPILNQY